MIAARLTEPTPGRRQEGVADQEPQSDLQSTPGRSGGMAKVASKSAVGPKRAKVISPVAGTAGVSAEVAGFIAKFDPHVAGLIRHCRRELRRQMPTAIELVYDNYNFFVIGYASTERASDCIVSLAAAANGVGLSFYYGAQLQDPAGLLKGAGKQNRYLRLPTAGTLKAPAVVALIRAAAAHGKTALPPSGRGRTIIKSVSKKQRPRKRKTAGDQ